MKKSIAMKWVAALESGLYKQCRGQLRKNDKFCVLGVLCNLHAEAHPEIASLEIFEGVYMRRSTLLPRVVAKWAGMEHVAGGFTTKHESLLTLNDERMLTFPAIAEVIRHNYRNL